MKYFESIELARSFRRSPTRAENIFWQYVRNRNFMNLKFYRQFIIEYSFINSTNFFYIVDFYTHTHKTIIEIDGEIHEHQIEYDEIRSNTLKDQGYNILQFKNTEIIYNWKQVKEQLRHYFIQMQ
jgi:leucyl-tRNA synthetase